MKTLKTQHTKTWTKMASYLISCVICNDLPQQRRAKITEWFKTWRFGVNLMPLSRENNYEKAGVKQRQWLRISSYLWHNSNPQEALKPFLKFIFLTYHWLMKSGWKTDEIFHKFQLLAPSL